MEKYASTYVTQHNVHVDTPIPICDGNGLEKKTIGRFNLIYICYKDAIVEAVRLPRAPSTLPTCHGLVDAASFALNIMISFSTATTFSKFFTCSQVGTQ